MIEIREFKPKYANEESRESYKTIKFEDKVSVTSSRYDVDRLISYKNRKGVEFNRI